MAEEEEGRRGWGYVSAGNGRGQLLWETYRYVKMSGIRVWV